MARESPGHTLQTTALVHEAYVRLVDSAHNNFQNRIHFLALCAQAMRRILVDWGPWDAYENLAAYYLALQRFDETHQIIRDAQARKIDDNQLRDALYALAFIASDSAAMAEQLQWFANKADYEHEGLALASDTEAYSGRLGKARELTNRAVDSAKPADNKEAGAVWQAIAAQREPHMVMRRKRGRRLLPL